VERELAAYGAQFEAAIADAAALAGTLTESQLEWRPAPPRWSVADCLNHLNVTAEKYLPRLEEMIARGVAEGRTGRGPFRHPFAGNWFVRMLEPPPRRRLRVPGVFAPVPGRPAGSLLPEFRRLRGTILQLLPGADGLDLAALKTSSPAARFFTLTLGQCFGALAAHDRRHLWQARQVVGHADFPKEALSG
jgi:hypothetical protein